MLRSRSGITSSPQWIDLTTKSDIIGIKGRNKSKRTKYSIKPKVERSQPNHYRKESEMTRKLISVQQVVHGAQEDGIELDMLYVDPDDIVELEEDDSDPAED
jgi:hypothetical protein